MLGCGRPVSLLGGAFAVVSRCLSAICFFCEASWWPSLELRPQRLARKDADARLPSMMNISTGQRALPVLHRGMFYRFIYLHADGLTESTILDV